MEHQDYPGARTLPPAPFACDGTRGDSPLRTGSASASLPMDCASRICQGRGVFSSLQPPQRAPEHPQAAVPSSDLSGTQLGPSESGSGRENGNPFKATAPGTHRCPQAGTHLRVEQLPSPPRRLRCRGNGDTPGISHGCRTRPCPCHSHNSPARSSSSSPRLCW